MPSSQEWGRGGFQVSKAKVRDSKMGADGRWALAGLKGQSLPETPLYPTLASSEDTDSGQGAGKTRPVMAELGFTSELSP